MLKPNFWKQYDKRWANVRGNGASVRANGCGPTSIANMVSVLIDPKITPDKVFKYMADHKYITGNHGSAWAGITATLKHFGIEKFRVISSAAEAKASVQAGHWLLPVVGPSRWTRGGHFFVLYDLVAGKCKISDSASSSDSRQENAPWSEYAKAERMQWIDINPYDYPKAGMFKAQYSKEYVLFVSDKKANIRKGRGLKYGVKAVVERGTRFVLYRYKDGWYRIKEGTYKGYYISEKCLSKYKPYVAKFDVIAKVPVYSGYTKRSEKIGTVAKGKVLKSSKKRGRWVYIPAIKGWVPKYEADKIYLTEKK